MFGEGVNLNSDVTSAGLYYVKLIFNIYSIYAPNFLKFFLTIKSIC